MDDVFRKSVLITYYSTLMADRERERSRSIVGYASAFLDPAARRIVVEEACPPAPDDRFFGPHRLLEHLGHGGQSEVWLAFDPATGQFTALKIPRNGADLERCREAYAHEHAVSSSIDPSGLRRVLGPLECDGTPALLMEYLEGRTLRELIDRTRRENRFGPVSLPEVGGAGRLPALLAFFESCCESIAAAHDAGFVHGDVKPANVFVAADGSAVILDLGAAIAVDAATPVDDDEGTLAYMAPERLGRTPGVVDTRSDVYGLAATIFEAITLKRPHTGPHQDSLVHAIVNEPPILACALDPSVPRSLAKVLDRALATNPAMRTPTCTALGADLARERRRLTRKGVARLAGPIVAVAIVVVAIAFLVHSRSDDRARRVDAPGSSALFDLDVLVDEGFLALDDLEPDRAIAAFERVLAEDPGCAEAVAGISWAWLQRRDPVAAAVVVERFETQFGRSKGLEILRTVAEREARGEVALAGVDPVDAWRDLEFSDDPVALFIMARNMLVERGRSDRASAARAMHLFDRAILLSSSDRMVLFRGRAVAAGLAGDVDEAETAAVAITQRWPESAVAWYYSGLALEIVDRDRAERAYRRSLDLDEKYGRALVGLGWLLVRKGNAVHGEQHLRRAVETTPRLAIGHVRLGYLLYGSGRVAEAHDCIAAAIELGYDGPEARFNYGANLVWAGRSDEGVDVAERLHAARPEAVWLLANLGACLVLSHRYDDAIAALEPVDESGDPGVEYAIGLALEETGRFGEAAARYQRALGALGGDDSREASVRADRVDLMRPRPRYPEFDAADVSAQRSWCASRSRRLVALRSGEPPADVAEALAAQVYPAGPETVERRLATISELLRPPLDVTVRADDLVACMVLALTAPASPRSPRRVADWAETTLDLLEDERGGFSAGAERFGILRARRYSRASRVVLGDDTSPLSSVWAEFWSEVDAILGPAEVN